MGRFMWRMVTSAVTIAAVVSGCGAQSPNWPERSRKLGMSAAITFESTDAAMNAIAGACRAGTMADDGFLDGPDVGVSQRVSLRLFFNDIDTFGGCANLTHLDADAFLAGYTSIDELAGPDITAPPEPFGGIRSPMLERTCRSLYNALHSTDKATRYRYIIDAVSSLDSEKYAVGDDYFTPAHKGEDSKRLLQAQNAIERLRAGTDSDSDQVIVREMCVAQGVLLGESLSFK